MRTPISSHRFRRVVSTVRIALWSFVGSIVLVMISERVYWYWAGMGPASLVELPAFYLVATLPALWLLRWLPAREPHQVVLAGALYGFVVEGVLTPIIYTDGPLPILAALFVGWHGILAFVGGWYLVHRLLVERRRRALARLAAAFGAVWGIWAAVAALGDPPAEFPAAQPLVPGAFGRYALGVGITFLLAHWLLGFVWPLRRRPTRWSTALIVGVAVVYLAIAVLPAVPWAPAKLAVLVGGILWPARRSRSSVSPVEPPVLDRLAGRVRLRDAAVLLVAPATATTTYGLATWHVPPGGLVVLYWVAVAAQVLGGGVAVVWATRRALAPPRTPGTSEAPSTVGAP